MPAKNSISKFHGRHRFLSLDLWKRYRQETGDKISYDDFRAIVEGSMVEVKKWVLKDPIGFQISKSVGNIAINKFKSSATFKTYLYTSKGPIPNYNLHTGGNVYKVQWFHATTTHKSRSPYWFFKASRLFNRDLASLLKSGKNPNYNSFMQNQFVNNSCK